MQLCSSLSILWHFLSLGLKWKLTFFILWPLLSFPNLLTYWVQHFHSIIFQDLKQLNWNSITSTSFFRIATWQKQKDSFIRVQFSSASQLCPTFCDPMNCSTPGLPVHHQLLESTQPMSIELVMPSNHLLFCRPLLLLPPVPPSIRVFSNESVLPIRWPKYWRFNFSISPFNEYSGLISFRIDRLDLLPV